MQQQSSISQEVLSLFDRIRKQSDEYVMVHDLMTKKSYELDRTRHSAHQQLLTFHTEAQKSISEFVAESTRTLESFKDKISNIEQLYTNLDDIKALAKNLDSLKSSLESKSLDLDTMLHSLRYYIKNETEKEFINQDKRLATKISRIENDVATFDSRLYYIQEQSKREYSTLSEDIDRFKNKVAETKFIIDETTRIVNDTIERAEEEFNKKINNFNKALDGRIAEAMTNFTLEQHDGSFNSKVSMDVNQLLQRVQSTESKLNTCAMIAFSAIAIAVIFGIIGIVF
jgi:hypothetical protein